MPDNDLTKRSLWFGGGAAPAETPEAVAFTENDIRETAQRNGRACGACSLCCKVFELREFGGVKPPGRWCQHCKPGHGGCGIYDTRPPVCRTFACQWLLDPTMSDVWFPLRSKIVVTIDDRDERLIPVVTAAVDPGHPDAWRREPYYSELQTLAQAIGPGGHLAGDRPGMVKIRVGERVWALVPGGAVEMTPESAKQLGAYFHEAVRVARLRQA